MGKMCNDFKIQENNEFPMPNTSMCYNEGSPAFVTY